MLQLLYQLPWRFTWLSVFSSIYIPIMTPTLSSDSQIFHESRHNSNPREIFSSFWPVVMRLTRLAQLYLNRLSVYRVEVSHYVPYPFTLVSRPRNSSGPLSVHRVTCVRSLWLPMSPRLVSRLMVWDMWLIQGWSKFSGLSSSLLTFSIFSYALSPSLSPFPISINGSLGDVTLIRNIDGWLYD